MGIHAASRMLANPATAIAALAALVVLSVLAFLSYSPTLVTEDIGLPAPPPSRETAVSSRSEHSNVVAVRTNPWPPRRLFNVPQQPRTLSKALRETAKGLLLQSMVAPESDDDEYEDLLRFHAFLYETQNPHKCTDAPWTHYASACGGMGSQMRCLLNSFIAAVSAGNVFIETVRIKTVDPRRCARQTHDCIFQRSTHCTGPNNMSARLRQGNVFQSSGDWNPVALSDSAGLSGVYESFWYFREAWRYISRPGNDLKAMVRKVKEEMKLNQVRTRGLGVHIRVAREKDNERNSVSARKCLPLLTAPQVLTATKELIEKECARWEGGCKTIIVGSDLASSVRNLSSGLGPSYPVTTMPASYFLQSQISEKELQERSHTLLLKVRAKTGVHADEDLALVTQMWLMASMDAVIGDGASSYFKMVCVTKSLGPVRNGSHSCISFEPEVYLQNPYGFSKGWYVDPYVVNCNQKALSQAASGPPLPLPAALPPPVGLDAARGVVLQARFCMASWHLFPKARVALWRLAEDDAVDAAVLPRLQHLLIPDRVEMKASGEMTGLGGMFVFAVTRHPLVRVAEVYLDLEHSARSKRNSKGLPQPGAGDAFDFGREGQGEEERAGRFMEFIGGACSEWSVAAHCLRRRHHLLGVALVMPQVACQSEAGPPLHCLLRLETLERDWPLLEADIRAALPPALLRSNPLSVVPYRPRQGAVALLRSLQPEQLQVLCDLFAADLRYYNYTCADFEPEGAGKEAAEQWGAWREQWRSDQKQQQGTARRAGKRNTGQGTGSTVRGK